jgi:hypothetical protein
MEKNNKPLTTSKNHIKTRAQPVIYLLHWQSKSPSSLSLSLSFSLETAYQIERGTCVLSASATAFKEELNRNGAKDN